MALAGPFGTWREPVLERLGFWIVGAGGGVLAGAMLDRGLRRVEFLSARPIARTAVLTPLITGLAAPIASSAAALIHARPIDWALCLKTVPQIAMVGAGYSALLILTRRRVQSAREIAPPDPTLGGLLPLKLSGARLLALEAQDHYVRVHTDQGADLVLIGLEAAVAKAAGVDGRRVHRSWWVARAAVVGVRRGEGRAVLALRGGPSVPVSRRYAKDLRSAGWY